MVYRDFPQKTSLYTEQCILNAKFVEFSGWLLPVQYSSIIEEHLHTRSANTIFDISHMGEIIIDGDASVKDLEYIFTRQISNMKHGSCRYGFFLDDSGCFIDDCIVYRYSDNKFMLVVNAGRIDADLDWLKNHISPGTSITDVSSGTAKIDLQGPLSCETASKIIPGLKFSKLKKFTFQEFRFNGWKGTVSATGYTGEKGFEFFIPAEAAPELWREFIKIKSVLPAGLGARDSLRLEKGYSLYGHDITGNITPVEANLMKFVDLNKEFIGKDTLEKKALDKPDKLLVPFLCEGRRSARDGYRAFYQDTGIGYVTSGVYSPSLQRGIGLCLLNLNYSAVGTAVCFRHDNIVINAEIIKLPFV